MNATLNLNTCTLNAPSYTAPAAPAYTGPAAPAPAPSYTPEVPVTDALVTLSPQAATLDLLARSDAEYAKFDPDDKNALFNRAFQAGLFTSEDALEIQRTAKELTAHYMEGRAEAGRPATAGDEGEVAFMALAFAIDQKSIEIAQERGVANEEQAHLLVELEHAASNYVSLRGEALGGRPDHFANLMDNPAYDVA